MKKKIFILIIVIITAIVAFILVKGTLEATKIQVASEKQNIDYYTCGMHPSVRVSPEEYAKGKTNCPICNMNLIPVYIQEAETEEVYYGCGVDTDGKCPHCDLGKPDTECICGEHVFVIEGEKIDCPVCGKALRELTQQEADKLKGIVSRVKIKGEQLTLAGVKTEPVKRLHLYKEIRTVGRVAYDPKLAISQEEFISALKALDKIKESGIPEIKERTLGLVESSKRKLRLLGLSDEQIKELEDKRTIQTSLILPEEKMWIYGDVYEFELPWIKAGEKVKITTPSLPGEEFYGVIISINPVLDPKTRSVRIRAEVDNPGLRLKPEMYVAVVIISMYKGLEGEDMVLAIPKDAVLDTGTRKIVWVDKGDNEYEGRDVAVGPEATSKVDGKELKFYPVIKGLAENELVVTKANFLIDSQSQLSGEAAAAYGGALGTKEEAKPPLHKH